MQVFIFKIFVTNQRTESTERHMYIIEICKKFVKKIYVYKVYVEVSDKDHQKLLKI